jgi:hypothetical protein
MFFPFNLYAFLPMIAMTGTLEYWADVVKADIPALFPILGGKSYLSPVSRTLVIEFFF